MRLMTAWGGVFVFAADHCLDQEHVGFSEQCFGTVNHLEVIALRVDLDQFRNRFTSDHLIERLDLDHNRSLGPVHSDERAAAVISLSHSQSQESRFWIGWVTKHGDKCARSTCRD